MIKKRQRKGLDNRPSISGFYAAWLPTGPGHYRPFPAAPLENVRKSPRPSRPEARRHFAERTGSEL